MENQKNFTDRDWLEAYLDNDLSPPEREELEMRLCLEDNLADLFISVTHHEAIIYEWAQFQSCKFAGAFSVVHDQRIWLASLSRTKFLVSASVLTLTLLCGIIFFFMRQSPAIVLNANQAVFANSNNEQITINPGEKIQQNKQFVLSHGTIELLFPTGVMLLIAAPAKFEVTGKNELNLSQGKLFAIVATEEGKGFTAHTPSGSVTDLGTIFGVEVDQLGTSSVKVFKGKVELASSSGEKFQLSAGKTVRCVARTSNWQETEKLTSEFNKVIHNQTLLPETVFVGDLGTGIVGFDSSQIISYVMYTATPAEIRFPPFPTKDLTWDLLAQHLVVVHFDESTRKWKLQRNDDEIDFIPVSTDLIIARTEPVKRQPDDTWSRKVTLFKSQTGIIHGISFGYKTSDITIRPDWAFGRQNIGEFTLKGTHFIRQPK